MDILISSPCSASYIIQHGIKSWPIWESEPRTFEWKYDEKEICLIHLSSKWINRYFLEDQFINLLNKLENTGKNIVMSSDQSSGQVFNKIYRKYKKITNEDFKNLKNIDEILILDELDFDNWTSIINSSTYVITPECGCTHIASLTDCNLCVIYDADNLPEMIAQEYAPWKKNYTKLRGCNFRG